MVASPGGCLTSLRNLGRRGHQTAVAKFSISWTSEQNSTHWDGSLWRICCRHKTDKRGCTTGVRGCDNSRREIRYFQRLVQNYSQSGKGPLWSHGRWGSSIMRSNERIGVMHVMHHLNLLKRWNEGTSVGLAAVVSNEDDLGPEAALKHNPLALVSGGDHLSPRQLTDLAQLQADFAFFHVFSPLPGRTDLVQHHIKTLPGEMARSRPYRLPEHKKNVVQEELKAKESHSDWASPIVLVPKTDGSVRFCVDYRKVNAVTKFDAYPMPPVDELLDRLGAARFYSTLDLTKGYWQIPLSPLSKEKTAFTTPFGLHQFVTLPFGLFGAPATFQRLMDKVLRPHSAYAAAYLDDIIIHSNDWQRHMEHLRAVLRSLRVAGLTSNPAEVSNWAGGVTVSGLPLGSWAGVSPN